MESPKGAKDKDNSRTWKVKMAKKFKRSGSSSNHPSNENSEVSDGNASFGVPLEYCPSSSHSEVWPRRRWPCLCLYNGVKKCKI